MNLQEIINVYITFCTEQKTLSTKETLIKCTRKAKNMV